MDIILDFIVSNYIWFLVVTLILVFALIGYLVDTKKDERFTKKVELDKEIEARLDVAAAANLTLNQMVQKQSEDFVGQINDANNNQNSAVDSLENLDSELSTNQIQSTDKTN